MIRLSANLSKKIPLSGIAYSSSQCGASLEIEVSDADKPEAIQARIRELYTLLSSAIDEQIGTVTPTAPVQHQNGNGHVQNPLPPAPQSPPQPVQRRNGVASGQNRVAAANGTANGRSTGATSAQQKAIWAICKNIGVTVPEVLSEFGVTDMQALSVRQASQVIDSLKARQNGAQQPQ